MENRSYALFTGLFTILLLVATAIVAVWLQRDQTNLVPYDLVTYDSVQGLSPQATVRYRGLSVGKVDSISFDPDRTGAMLIRIGVRPDTPMTDTLKATVEMQGITGIGYIDLDDNGKPGKPLHSSSEQVARIEMQPGLTERLLGRANQLMDSLQGIGTDLQGLLSADNRQSFSEILASTAEASQRFDRLLASIEPLTDDIPPLVATIEQATREAARAANRIGSLADDTGSALKEILGPQGVVNQATRSLAQIERTVASLGTSVPDINSLAQEMGETVSAARRTIDNLERAPQSLLFGAPPPRPGPGEDGFSGFQ